MVGALFERNFGSVSAFKKQFNATTAGIQRSSCQWGWLAYNPLTMILEIVTTANLDPLLSERLYVVALQLLTSLVKPTSPSSASTFGNTCIVAIPTPVHSCLTFYFRPFIFRCATMVA